MSIQNSYQLFHDELQLHKIYEQISRPIIIADGMQNPENMGAVLRLAANIGALNTLFLSQRDQEFKKHKIQRTASGAANKTTWSTINPAAIIDHIPKDYTIVALETTADAEHIFQFQWPEKVALLTGNEVSGIHEDVLAHAKHKVYIPIPGPISSLNVTHALAIGLFQWLNQQWK